MIEPALVQTTTRNAGERQRRGARTPAEGSAATNQKGGREAKSETATRAHLQAEGTPPQEGKGDHTRADKAAKSTAAGRTPRTISELTRGEVPTPERGTQRPSAH